MKNPFSLPCGLMYMSEKCFVFFRCIRPMKKSFRSIRANEQTRCSARLRHDWSRPIEQQGEITLHLLCTTVRLLLASFVFSNRQLACYVAHESAVLWICDGAVFMPLIQSSTEPQNSSLGALQLSLDLGLFLTWWWLERLCVCDVWSSYPTLGGGGTNTLQADQENGMTQQIDIKIQL